ncbi:Hypothetical predicted protein [Marmota monax]|nr:hypothetical protein GHT09_009468 [Marmota monax]VTJ87630.1 Hypothetical predicted protein [Marmota monax]
MFILKQFKEWKFCLYGVGLLPQPADIEKITTPLGLQSSFIIPFKNPTEEDVVINIMLTNHEQLRHLLIDQCWDSFINENSAFQFNSLSHIQGIALPPKGNIDIPVLFMPKIMKLCKTMVIVQMMRANGEKWHIDNFDELDTEIKR